MITDYLINRVAELNKNLSHHNRPNYTRKENEAVRGELINILERFYNMKREYLLTVGVKN